MEPKGGFEVRRSLPKQQIKCKIVEIGPEFNINVTKASKRVITIPTGKLQ